MASVHLSRAGLAYPLYDVIGRSLKVAMMRRVTESVVKDSGAEVIVHSLKNVTLDLREGDRLGLIGRNGAGKTSLLRLLAGLAHPTSGTARVTGRVVPLIERGLGINPELSGEQNIELPLRFLGATNDEVERAREDIPRFAELGEFYYLPVRTYSEGMRARLTFALCTAIDADILILDEWLGAGDVNFISQAEIRLRNTFDGASIVVLASHSTELIRAVCNKVAWLDGGRIVAVGDPDRVIAAYLAAMHHLGANRIAAE